MMAKIESAITRQHAREADTLLRELISEYSERGWCAGWLIDIDKKVFKLIQQNYEDLALEEDADLLCAIKTLSELYNIFPSYTKTYTLDGYIKYLAEPIALDTRPNPLLALN